jgi:pimeloyl-ACP methyl ester carboxylesterase
MSHLPLETDLPWNRLGDGPGRLIVFQGMQFENRPASGLPLRYLRGLYGSLETEFTIDVVTRRPGLPRGYSLREMSDDYATMIRENLQGSVDLIGLSTGGLIAQHFAADHSDLLRRLVLHSSACRLRDEARRLQLRVGDLARERRWSSAYAALFAFILSRGAPVGRMARIIGWLASPLGGVLLGKPADPSDMVVTYAASNEHDFRDRLKEIRAPTLVAGGDRDPFYTPELFRQTAAGIPSARLALYPGVDHPAAGKAFARDLRSFLGTGVDSED